MIKNIPPNAWGPSDEPQIELIKFAAAGFRGTDFAEFTKRSSHPLAMWVRDNPPKPGEIYVHTHIFGTSENFGQNRNADAYSTKMAREWLSTYEKFGRHYLNHNNRNPAKSYGVVKRAYLNEVVGRAETIVALNATKEAAERNGGLIAERTLNKMANNIDVAVSQSCKIPFDICLSCGNQAKNRLQYCGPENCKYGGCRDNLGRVFDDGFHMGVDNPICQFFDHSDVSDTRGADRTAFITGKVAAHGRIIGGAELAEQLGLIAPDYLLDPVTVAAVSALRKLASIATPQHEPVGSWDAALEIREKRSSGFAKQADTPTNEYDRHQLLAELSSDGVILPPARWLSMLSGTDLHKCASLYMGGVSPQHDLLDRADLHDVLASENYTDSRLSPPSSYSWMSPTIGAHAEESSRAVITGRAKFSAVQAPKVVRDEAAARYLAYQANTLAKHAHKTNYPMLLLECARHNTGLTV